MFEVSIDTDFEAALWCLYVASHAVIAKINKDIFTKAIKYFKVTKEDYKGWQSKKTANL